MSPEEKSGLILDLGLSGVFILLVIVVLVIVIRSFKS